MKPRPDPAVCSPIEGRRYSSLFHHYIGLEHIFGSLCQNLKRIMGAITSGPSMQRYDISGLGVGDASSIAPPHWLIVSKSANQRRSCRDGAITAWCARTVQAPKPHTRYALRNATNVPVHPHPVALTLPSRGTSMWMGGQSLIRR